MKKSMICVLLLLISLLSGCNAKPAKIAATTLPVYEFTSFLCEGTEITVSRLVTEDVSCLHDYTLQISQMQAVEAAEWIVISGAGMESFLEDALAGKDNILDASAGIPLICDSHGHEHNAEHGHNHESDPHIWLSIHNARLMADNICAGLARVYPEYTEVFFHNLIALNKKFDALQEYAEESLTSLSCRKIVTFHDGFAYLADDFDLQILKALEEESGSEASASELIALIRLVTEHNLPAIFTEINGSTSAAEIIASETGVAVFALDMAMSGESYFEAMHHNITVLKEALG